MSFQRVLAIVAMAYWLCCCVIHTATYIYCCLFVLHSFAQFIWRFESNTFFRGRNSQVSQGNLMPEASCNDSNGHVIECKRCCYAEGGCCKSLFFDPKSWQFTERRRVIISNTLLKFFHISSWVSCVAQLRFFTGRTLITNTDGPSSLTISECHSDVSFLLDGPVASEIQSGRWKIQ